MKKYEFRDALQAAVPTTPPLFRRAVRDTLADIESTQGRAAPQRPPVRKRRTLTLVLAIVLLVAAVATAATLLSRNVFDVTMGTTPENAASLIHYDVAKQTIGDAEIIVREAAYDGITLYMVYSIRDLTATEPWGETDEMGMRYLGEEDYARMDALGVGWWTDNLWIDGQQVGMPAMSGGESIPGDQNGEVLHYMQYRLDQENVYLDGKNVEIALPIGERQPLDSLVVHEDPFRIEKPEKGMVTFQLDCSSRDQVTRETPDVLMEGPEWSAKVTEVVYSPIQMYVTLQWEIRPEVLEAYIAENGDGYYDEEGNMLWAYDALEVCGGDIMGLRLVDAAGAPVFETMQGFYGCGGASTTQAWFTFPYAKEYPQEMYLAPDDGTGVDMTRAVRVK